MTDQRAFLMHKPLSVVCSTVDSKLTDIVRDTTSENFGAKRGGVPRLTIYDIAAQAGFPGGYGNIGRLDAETSGILLFTRHSVFAERVRDPAVSREEYAARPNNSEAERTSYEQYLQTKAKTYELLLLPGRSATKQLVAADLHFDATAFEQLLSAPFSFQRNNVQFQTSPAEVRVVERFQDEKFSHGRPELGWCVRCHVTLREGKHHQIRRLAQLNDYKVISLTRIQIAGILAIESVPQPGDCRWLTAQEFDHISLHLGV